MNHQHLPNTPPAGVNSYQEVPITIPKEEGRLSPTLGVGKAGEDRKGIFSRGTVLLTSKQRPGWRMDPGQPTHSCGTLSTSGLYLGLDGQMTFQCSHSRILGLRVPERYSPRALWTLFSADGLVGGDIITCSISLPAKPPQHFPGTKFYVTFSEWKKLDHSFIFYDVDLSVLKVL